MKRQQGLTIVIIALWAIMLTILCAIGLTHTEAQDTPPVVTIFEQGCIEGLDVNHYRIHFYYTSTGTETFTFQMGEVIPTTSETLPYAGHAFTNVPARFSTLEGVHDDFYLEGQGDTDSQYTFTLIFTNDMGTAIMLLNTWDYPVWCEPGAYATPSPMPTNEPYEVPAIQAPMHLVKMCVVKYPQVILVCSGR